MTQHEAVFKEAVEEALDLIEAGDTPNFNYAGPGFPIISEEGDWVAADTEDTKYIDFYDGELHANWYLGDGNWDSCLAASFTDRDVQPLIDAIIKHNENK